MPAIGFKKEFKDDVYWGIKRQTIRRVRKVRRIKIGDQLNLYTGMRTPQCKLIRKAICTSLKPITIFWGGVVSLDGQKLTNTEIKILALADGFLSTRDFMNFFKKTYGHFADCQDGFEGELIEWELYKSLRSKELIDV